MKNTLITGANKGIGFETATLLAQRGDPSTKTSTGSGACKRLNKARVILLTS
jgi:NAD(P)-dependent dehydrogenase (short-subunit alcohol dehydrogenase family)